MPYRIIVVVIQWPDIPYNTKILRIPRISVSRLELALRCLSGGTCLLRSYRTFCILLSLKNLRPGGWWKVYKRSEQMCKSGGSHKLEIKSDAESELISCEAKACWQPVSDKLECSNPFTSVADVCLRKSILEMFINFHRSRENERAWRHIEQSIITLRSQVESKLLALLPN